MIIIINGSLGVGKTETSWHLLSKFERAIMLDGDYIGAVHPFEIYDEARVNYLYDTFCHLIKFHQAYAYHHFVINYVFETPQTLADLCHRLADLDDKIYAFHLICAEMVQAERIHRRNRDDLAWQLKRFQELNAIQEAASKQGHLGYPIITTHLTIEQAAEAILAEANNLASG